MVEQSEYICGFCGTNKNHKTVPAKTTIVCNICFKSLGKGEDLYYCSATEFQTITSKPCNTCYLCMEQTLGKGRDVAVLIESSLERGLQTIEDNKKNITLFSRFACQVRWYWMHTVKGC